MLQAQKKSKVESGSDEVEAGGCCDQMAKRAFPTGYCKELKGTLAIAWALVITQVCEQYFQPIAVMFGGHLGKLELDAIAMSNTLINVLGNSIVIGMASCCETTFSQSYGYGNYKMIGVYLQRSLYIHLMALLVCYSIHLNIEPILVAMGQDPDVSRLTGQYMLYFMPGIFFLFVTCIMRRYTQCQSSVVPHIFIMLSGHGLHALLQYLFLYQFKLGILGSAIAQDVTFCYICIVTLIYTLCSKAHKISWGGWDKRSLLEWGPLAKLAVFGLLMTCFEWWAFEISTILAGIIGTTELAAQSVAFNLDSLCFGIPYGLSIAAGIRVGQFLGANQPMHAKTAARVGMTLTIGNGLIWAILYIAARYQLPKLFTSDPEVIHLVAQILPILALYSVGSAINTLGRGVFRGVGWQMSGAILSFICFYVVAWPIAIPLTFLTDLSIVGMWLGLFIAITLCGFLYLIIINFKINWGRLAKEAVERGYEDDLGKSVTKDEPSEKTPLILSASMSFSQSLTVAATREVQRPGAVKVSEDEQVTGVVICKRVATVCIFVGIFLVGLIIRLTTQGSNGGLVSDEDGFTALYTTMGLYNATQAAGVGGSVPTEGVTLLEVITTAINGTGV